MLDEQTAEARAQLDREALAGLDPNSMMMEVGYRPNGQAVFDPMGVPSRTFRDGIAADEWKIYDDPAALREMRAKNYYQLTKIALQDIGMMEGEDWPGMWDIRSLKEFNANWEVQERAMTLYMENNETYLQKHQERNGWISNFDGLKEETAAMYKAIERRLRIFENGTYN